MYFFADPLTISLDNNNFISQLENDTNLCKISKFTIKSKDGTEILANLNFTDDNSETISDLLEKQKALIFEFEDAYGVTTILWHTPTQPGIFWRAKCFDKIILFNSIIEKCSLSVAVLVFAAILVVSVVTLVFASLIAISTVIYRRIKQKNHNPALQQEVYQSVVYCEIFEPTEGIMELK